WLYRRPGPCRRGWCRLGAGELAHRAREVGSRRQLGHQGFDLPPRSVPGFGEDRLVVLRREVPSQQADGGQAQGTRSQELEDQGESSAGSSGLDATARGILGEPKRLSAVREERAVALSRVEGRAA